MHVEGSVYFCDHLTAPWSMEFKETTSASFHLVRRGECWVISEGRTECLGPGDLVFVEPGRDHVLASHSPDRDPPTGEVQTLLLCAYCSFSDVIDTPLVKVFPSLSIVREEELIKHSWLKSTALHAPPQPLQPATCWAYSRHARR